MRFILAAIILCACGDVPAGYLEPCDVHTGCIEVDNFCQPDLGVCTRVCRVPGLPVCSARDQCVPSADCPDACCLLRALWPGRFDGTLSGSGVCVPSED